MPPALANIQHGSNCLRNVGGPALAAASSCVTDFVRAVFVERLRCGAVRNPYDGNHALSNLLARCVLWQIRLSMTRAGLQQQLWSDAEVEQQAVLMFSRIKCI